MNENVSARAKNIPDFLQALLIEDVGNAHTYSTGDKETINIDFPLGWYLISPAPFDASYDIRPEVVSFRCASCQGDGYILKICPICQGLKTLTETKEITEICSTCEGKKQLTCQTCNGTGKVRRFP